MISDFQTFPDSPNQDFDQTLWATFCAGFRQITNLELDHYHQPALKRRLFPHLRDITSDTLPEYLEHLSNNKKLLLRLFSDILIHESTFFRDPATWDLLGSRLAKSPRPSLRCLSAGCSRGQEAYTMAIVAAEALPDSEVQINGIDIGQNVIIEAELGKYFREDLQLVPSSCRDRYFTMSRDSMDTRIYAIVPEVRSRVSFSLKNVFEDSIDGPYDVIACRNIALHLSEEGSQRLFQRLTENLAPGGFFITGGTDTVKELDRLELKEIGLDVFQKHAS